MSDPNEPDQDSPIVFPCSNCGYPSVRSGCVCKECGTQSDFVYFPGVPATKAFIDSLSLPAVDTTLDNCLDVRDAKLKQIIDSPSVLNSLFHGRDYSWKYDRPEFREDLKCGLFHVPLDRVERDYLKWVDDSQIATLRNIATGQKVRKLCSRRGNPAYASHQRMRFSDIDRAIDALVNQYPVIPGSNGAMTRVLLVTFTHDPSIVPSEAEAWMEFTSRLNQWKVQAKRAFNATHMTVLCAKEACGGDGPNQDYPAPHAIVILSHPVVAFRWVSKVGKHRGKVSYRVDDEVLRKELKRIWPYGTLDIQAVVGGRVVVDGKEQRATQYILKYITKSINVASDPEQTHLGVGVRTMALSKLYHVAPVAIGADLRRTLAEFVRLDSMMSTLQQQQQPVASLWRYESAVYVRSADVIHTLVKDPPPDKRPYPIVGSPHPLVC